MNIGYFFLLLTIMAESTAVIFMKFSGGFQYKIPAAISIIAYVLGFLFLTLALKTLPAGLANAIWAGASVVLVTLAGVVFFKEQVSPVQWLFLSLVVIGLIGLNFTKNG